MKRALIVIDVQNEYVDGKLRAEYPSDALTKILMAIGHAKEAKIPVVIVQHTESRPGHGAFVKYSRGWELHDAVKKVVPDLYVEKHLPSAFFKTPLENYLRDTGVTTVAICGYATQVCCDTTARYAMHLGYDVEFLADATGTLDLETPLGRVDAKTLFNAAVATQAAVFSKVLDVNAWAATLKTIKE